MRAWPKAFECLPEERQAFISACEAIEIYGLSREQWKCDLDKATADFVWQEAKRLLNLNY